MVSGWSFRAKIEGVPVIEMDGVREYSEELPVELAREEDGGRLVVFARNEAGYSNTRVDLFDLLAWLDQHPGWEQMDVRTII